MESTVQMNKSVIIPGYLSKSPRQGPGAGLTTIPRPMVNMANFTIGLL
jgi:hypothetical protein